MFFIHLVLVFTLADATSVDPCDGTETAVSLLDEPIKLGGVCCCHSHTSRAHTDTHIHVVVEKSSQAVRLSTARRRRFSTSWVAVSALQQSRMPPLSA